MKRNIGFSTFTMIMKHPRIQQTGDSELKITQVLVGTVLWHHGQFPSKQS
jgi:hypothetical protein